MAYSFDAASQLAGITYSQGANTLESLSYVYDLAGRRMNVGGTFARTGVPQAVSSASYNVNNQLTNWKGASLTCDANGNLTNDGTNTYTWNARNQLVSISGGVAASFQYDAFGRRVSKTIRGTTQFLYDGVNPVQEISGTSASANLLTGGVDEYFQRTDSAGARGFLTDALGSTLALADSTGTVQTSYTFEPFGNTTVTGAATTNSFAFTAREFDPTGLYFYRARYYSPSLQRFIDEDPIDFAGGDSNLYRYVGDSPTNGTDPLGFWGAQAHNQIIWNALHSCGGVSNGDIYQIQQGSQYADTSPFQAANFSYMHMMRNGDDPNQTTQQVQDLAAAFTAGNLQVAAKQLNAGVRSQAMFSFGLAMHPLMDQTSPAHTDANGNALAWCGLGGWCSDRRLHGDDSNPLTLEGVNELNRLPGVQQAMNITIRSYFQQLSGRKLHCN